MGKRYANIQKIYHLIMVPENSTRKYSPGSWGKKIMDDSGDKRTGNDFENN